ncbi:MAG: phospholipase D family protein [Burkholderia sp.]
MTKILATIALSVVSSLAIAAQPLPPGAAIDVGFSPAGSALEVVLHGINSAQSSIVVAAYSFTNRPIAAALVDAQRRGVKVAVVADRGQNSRSYSAVTFLANHGVPVRLNDHYESMHDKFLVIDGQNVETGSFNYSSAADRNAENAVLLWHVKPLADQYTAEWQRLWQEGADLKAAY